MPNEIEIKITIPEREYKQWNSFERGGAFEVQVELRKLISQRLRQDFIEDFEIELTPNPH
jgi:hypothetical protein